MNMNFRVFRRNNKNLILLWSRDCLTEVQRDDFEVYLGSPEDGAKLRWGKFTPDSPEKFTSDVDGVVISHAINSMDPSKSCTVSVAFGTDDDMSVMTKSILPANSTHDPAKPRAESGRVIHLYAMDYDKQEWVPLPVNGLAQGDHTLLLKEAIQE